MTGICCKYLFDIKDHPMNGFLIVAMKSLVKNTYPETDF